MRFIFKYYTNIQYQFSIVGGTDTCHTQPWDRLSSLGCGILSAALLCTVRFCVPNNWWLVCMIVPAKNSHFPINYMLGMLCLYLWLFTRGPHLNLVTPSLGFSCLVLYVQLPPGSAPSHPSSSCDGCSSGCCPGTTGDSSCLCCSSYHQVHWDPAGPVLKTEL